jgi:hypothetical protein
MSEARLCFYLMFQDSNFLMFVILDGMSSTPSLENISSHPRGFKLGVNFTMSSVVE